jgi:TolB-like protein
MTSFLSEIRRRSVFKVAVAYVVVGWILIQIADVLGPQLNLPDWAPRLVTFILLLGFPLTLVLAWVFEVTPEGIKTESGSKTDKTLVTIAGVLVAAAIALYAWNQPESNTTSSDRTIAVLPFVNMSGDPDNEYFSDGISEELLNVLAHMPELQVASRTSSFAFKGQQKELPEIAEELNVALVLEGSVRRQADQVRITAQLIDAASGFHLWSETYDRSLKDIFATQDEIAEAIAAALKLELGSPHRADRSGRVTEPDIYDKYLRARALFPLRGEAALRQAAAMFEEVIAADPQFAEAYAGLGLIYAVLPFYTTDARDETHLKARDAAEHALALDPGLAEAYGALGDVAIHALRYDLAEALLKRSVAESPSLAAGHYWLAEKHLYVGELDAALQELNFAKQLDPRSRTGGYLRAMTYLAMEKPDEARASCASVLDSAPKHESCRTGLLLIALGTRDYSSARQLLTNNPNVQDDDARRLAHSIADALEGKGDRRTLAQELSEMPYHAVFDPAHPGIVHDAVLPALILAMDEPELAIERFLINARNEAKDVLDVVWDPQLDPIRCDGKFQKTVTQLNVIDQRAESICQP